MAEPDGEVALQEPETPEPEPQDPAPRGRPNWRARAALAALCLVVAGLTSLGTVLWLQVGDANAAEQTRLAAVQAARQVAVNLTTVSKDSAQQDVQRLMDSATGSFRDQFGEQAEVFRKVLQQADVTSQGTVREAGVSSADADSAVVLAAVSATVKNTDAPTGEQRQYRMRMHLTKDGDRWLVSDLEFVP
ncbi:hypothetical protein GCM10010174_13290 [Kutzneria viridogrisea]|uniref:Secreted protein n=2 Tax=Kutzneria TaxID=43356 RepID=W5WKG9_9PSEU|nr:hypothetical protein [Kutzneria albida]AHI01067.1 hypothetical protein KALB_7709 [Kutzneria albida DSM 43870]MBA8926322.1 Mce-associated membrane protein [Kutzneria viridogrisea]